MVGEIARQIVDTQVHTWTEDTAEFPWGPRVPSTWHFEEETIPFEEMIERMDDAGVDAAMLVVPGIYAYDNSYALAAAAAFPDRLAVVGRIDPAPEGARERLETLMEQPGMIAIRVTAGAPGTWEGGEYDAMIGAAGTLGVPCCVYPGPDKLSELESVVQRQAGTTIILDHLGLIAPPVGIPKPPLQPFEPLPTVLALAKYDNVLIKISAVPALSHESFPFRDVWDAIHRVVDAFGPERVMWGTDFTRTAALHSYGDAVLYLDQIEGFDEKTKDQLYGENARRVFGWPTTSVKGA